MTQEDILLSLLTPGTFALLVARTEDGRVDIRPIGGVWGSDIIEAIREMDAKHPNCRFRLFEHNYDDWRRYFEGVVSRERLL